MDSSSPRVRGTGATPGAGVALACFMAIAVAGSWVGDAGAQVPDHLVCARIRESTARGQRTARITPAEVGIVAPADCVVQTPARSLCIDTRLTNVSPAVADPTVGPPAGSFLCYTLRCSRTRTSAVVRDAFGTHEIAVGSPNTICAPLLDGPAPTATPTPAVTATPAPTPTSGGTGLFEAPNPWNRSVESLTPATQSGAIIGWLDAAGGFGLGHLQIDFSMHLLTASPTTPFFSFQQRPGYYLPDCDTSFPFPLPAGGAIEGETGYSCPSGDCHLLVVDPATKRLYEAYQANVSAGTLQTGCAVVWDLTRAYPPELRGDQCTSVDAGGFPVAAMLFTADEVAAGEIPHAIRFILPNSRMRAGVYVRPATHAGGPSATSSNAPPYGVRFRLRADFPLASLPNDGARVIARAMQRYGMILSDGGNVALTAASDTYTTAKWADLGIDSHSLTAIQVTDFQVVDLGPAIPLTYDCVREP